MEQFERASRGVRVKTATRAALLQALDQVWALDHSYREVNPWKHDTRTSVAAMARELLQEASDPTAVLDRGCTSEGDRDKVKYVVSGESARAQ